MARSWRFYEQDLAYIADVTKALNSLPECDGYYLHVELREDITHDKVGEWCYEIAPDANFFTPEVNDTEGD